MLSTSWTKRVPNQVKCFKHDPKLNFGYRIFLINECICILIRLSNTVNLTILFDVLHVSLQQLHLFLILRFLIKY